MTNLDTYTTITARDVAQGDVIKRGTWTEGLRVDMIEDHGVVRALTCAGTVHYPHGNEYVLVLISQP